MIEPIKGRPEKTVPARRGGFSAQEVSRFWVFTMKVLVACTISLLWISQAPAHDSPIDHIDRVVRIYIDGGRLHVVYRFRCEERQALLQLHQMDKNGDGKISDEERDAYFNEMAGNLIKQLRVEVDGRVLELSSDGPVRLAPDLSQTFFLSAPLADLSIGAHAGKLSDDFSRTHPGPYRWSPRQLNRNGIDVDAIEAPGADPSGTHPAMIVINLHITVRPVKATEDKAAAKSPEPRKPR